MDRSGMRPIHPGEVLNKEFMEPLGMTVMDLAMPTKWPESEIEKACEMPAQDLRRSGNQPRHSAQHYA
ncbi:hypothetical protein [Pseudomonas atacamensis]|uniref:hypothetical protein n=1 Tax=Pseudomonas atacamensis TaxID=2565368 RepID=UPI001F1B6292|nr:hypothetical protein [Pseudomonas atacamensis]